MATKEKTTVKKAPVKKEAPKKAVKTAPKKTKVVKKATEAVVPAPSEEKQEVIAKFQVKEGDTGVPRFRSRFSRSALRSLSVISRPIRRITIPAGVCWAL